MVVYVTVSLAAVNRLPFDDPASDDRLSDTPPLGSEDGQRPLPRSSWSATILHETGSLALDAMFAPQSVAVVGASTSPQKAGGAMLSALESFPGAVCAIHPRADSIAGRPAYQRVADAPGPIDLAVLTVPRTSVPAVLEDCAEAGVRAAVVCAGGFAESDRDGEELQDRVASIARDAGIRVLGPNTSGFINPRARVVACFAPPARGLTPGAVGVVAQSGGVNLATSFLLHGEGMGVSLAVGLGNSIDVDLIAMLDFLAGDAATKAIALHIEGISDGRMLLEALNRVTQVKPVVALKVGRADVGDFARSHTGALTGDWALARAALAQAGAVVVDNLRELVDAVSALAATRLAPAAAPGVGVVTGQAGPGLLIADGLRTADIRLPEVAAQTRKRLGELLPPLTYQRNPVDTGRPEDTFPEVLRAVADDPAIDAMVIYALQEYGTFETVTGLARQRSAREVPPVVFVTGGLPGEMTPQRDVLRQAGIPSYTSPDGAIAGVRALVADARVRALAATRRPGGEVAAPEVPASGALDEDQAKTLLEQMNIRSVRRLTSTSRGQAHEALDQLEAPVVVKLLDATVLHKSDVGGVHLGIRTGAELDAALDRIDSAAGRRPARYLVEAQAPPGRELIVGARRDDTFGLIVLLALGGVDVELGASSILRIGPLAASDARAMVDQLPESVLAGGRGRPPVPIDELTTVIEAVASVVVHNPHVSEVEINPLRATADGLIALDALILISETS